jgi:hypothetical protein
MGDDQRKEFLHDAKRFPTTQGAPGQALMRVRFVNEEFDFPAFVIGTDKF